MILLDMSFCQTQICYKTWFDHFFEDSPYHLDQDLYQNLLKQLKNGLMEINFHYEERERLLSIIAELSSYDVGPIPSNIELILNLPEFET